MIETLPVASAFVSFLAHYSFMFLKMALIVLGFWLLACEFIAKFLLLILLFLVLFVMTAWKLFLAAMFLTGICIIVSKLDSLNEGYVLWTRGIE